MALRAQPRVLLIEDERELCELYAELLCDSGLETVTVTCQSDALAIIRDNPSICVLITDWLLQGGDGLSLIAEVQQDFVDRRHTQFILISGHASIESAKRALSLGASAFLTKPFSDEDLIREAWTAVTKAQALQSSEQQWNDLCATISSLSTKANSAILGSNMRASVNEARNQKLYSAQSSLASDPDFTAQLDQCILEHCKRNSFLNSHQLDTDDWVMLLVVLRASMRSAPLTVKAASSVSQLPLSTALRKLNDLERSGLIVKRDDPYDGRRVYLHQTPKAVRMIEGYFLERRFTESL